MARPVRNMPSAAPLIPAAQQPDLVNAPPHYTQGPIEAIDAIRSMLGEDGYIAFLRGTIAKYNWRVMHKGNSAQDAAKMRWYLNRLVEAVEKGLEND